MPRKPAVGFPANALDKEETEGPLAALGRRYGGFTLFLCLRLDFRAVITSAGEFLCYDGGEMEKGGEGTSCAVGQI